MESLEGELSHLALLGAQTIVTAMASDVWPRVRERLARLFARGEPARQDRQENRLEESRAELEPLAGAELEAARGGAVTRLRDRLEDLLEEDPAAVEALRRLMADYREQFGAGPATTVVRQRVSVRDRGRAYTVGSGSMAVGERRDEDAGT